MNKHVVKIDKTATEAEIVTYVKALERQGCSVERQPYWLSFLAPMNRETMGRLMKFSQAYSDKFTSTICDFQM